MDDEMDVLYAVVSAAVPLENRDAVDEALHLDHSTLVHSVIALDDETGTPVGQAAMREFGEVFEVRKVVVLPEYRGRGISKLLMTELEKIALEVGVHSLLLQTGNLQTEAIALYERIGYRQVPLYGKYAAVPGAICYEKVLD
jgi:GNAT superfamily N-acetyltransferase